MAQGMMEVDGSGGGARKVRREDAVVEDAEDMRERSVDVEAPESTKRHCGRADVLPEGYGSNVTDLCG